MPGALKFHLDEHVPPALADGLRRLGQILSHLLLMHQVLNSDEMKNRLEYV
jgi:hypothetical protein